MKKRRPLRLGLLMLNLIFPGQALVDPWNLDSLMRSLAAVTAVDARFTEHKRLAMLEQPLVTAGVLQYRAPGYVKKQTLTPHPETFEIDQDWLVIDNPVEGKRQVYLSGYPQIQAFVESFRATLAGDRQSLERHYRVQLQGQPEAWSLRLAPVDRRMAETISAVTIRGRHDRILSIETLEADGDRSLMTIEPVGGR